MGKRKWFSLLLVLCMVLSWMPIQASAYTVQQGTYGSGSWKLDSSGVLTISGTGPMSDYKDYVPEKNSPWVDYEDSIQKVIINPGVTDIADRAFYSCSNLEEITIPSTVKQIGDNAFSRCPHLKEISLPVGLEIIEPSAFTYSGIQEIVIPEKVTNISEYLFYECNSLTSVTFKGVLVDIANYAFYNCPQLQEVIFEGELSGEIGEHAFAYCDILAALDFPQGMERIEEHAFVGCKSLHSITLPDTLTHIGASAFRETALVSVSIPESVTYIGESAFIFCDELKNITMYTPAVEGIQNKLTEKNALEYVHIIGDAPQRTTDPFRSNNADFLIYYDEGTSGWEPPYWGEHMIAPWGKENVVYEGSCGENLTWKLEANTLTISGTGEMEYHDIFTNPYPWHPLMHRVKHIIVKEGVTLISSEAFKDAKNLTSLTIEPGVKAIQYAAFANCTALTDLTIGEGIETIGWSSFENCSALTKVILPDGLTTIESSAFQGCMELVTVSIPDSVTTLHNSIFKKCQNLKNVKLSARLTELPSSTFEECSNLAAVELPEGITKIGYSAFMGCTALTEIHIPDTVTEIEYSVFSGSALCQITIPASVTQMQNNVFSNCKALNYVYFEGNAPVFSDYAFSDAEFVAVYPADNETWTEDVRKNYGGSVTWLSSDHEHIYSDTATVVPPTCGEQGYTAHLCICGYTHKDTYVDPTGEHSFTDDYDPSCNVCGYERQISKVPVYRLYNPYTQEHLLTSGTEEKELLLSVGWKLDGIAWEAPVDGESVYRLYNPYDDWHTYTTSEEEKSTMVAAGWKVDGVVSRSAPKETGRPIYRLFNPYVQTNYHLITAGEEEIALLVSVGWILEGIAWYAET